MPLIIACELCTVPLIPRFINFIEISLLLDIHLLSSFILVLDTKKTATAFTGNYGLLGPMYSCISRSAAEAGGTLRPGLVHSALTSLRSKMPYPEILVEYSRVKGRK